MLYMGIDPGAKGAIAVLDTSNQRLITYRFMHGWIGAGSFVHIFKAASVCLEYVHAMPSDARSNAFSFGKYLGRIEGMLLANHMSIERTVSPQVWQREFRLGGLGKAERKHRVQELAREIFPNMNITLDLSDAILICLYHFRNDTGALTGGNRNTYATSPFQSQRQEIIRNPYYEV